jgi:hypothetical protein
MWAHLSEQSGETGPQPFLPGFLEPLMDYPPSERIHPWDTGEVNDSEAFSGRPRTGRTVASARRLMPRRPTPST